MRLGPVALALLLIAHLPPAHAEEASHLLLRIENPGDEHELTLEIQFDGAPAQTQTVRVPARETLELRFDLGQQSHIVYLMRKATDAPGPWTPVDDLFGGGIGTYGDNRGCDGAYLHSFWSDGTALSTHGGGCLARPPRFDALVEEARAAEHARGWRGIDVPPPRDADRGAYSITYGWIEDDEAAETVRFEWRGATRFSDGEGAALAGHELAYLDPGGSYAGSSGFSGGIAASAEQTVESAWYADGERAPVAWTNTLAQFAPSDGMDTSVEVLRERRFDDADARILCAFRSGFQGARWTAGDEARAECPAWSADGAAWRAGEPTEERGFRVIPFYLLVEGAQTRVARATFADGVAYPLRYEEFEQDEDGVVSARAWTLDALAVAGAPLPAEPASRAPHAARVAPLDPLSGPALDAARARFPLALDEAAAAARADPTLRALQEVLARDDAALLGAAMQTRRDEGSPAGVAEWFLLYGAQGVAPVGIVCSRPQAGPLGMSLPARCAEEDDAPPYASDLGFAPAVGAADVPALGATFDDAVARWDGARGNDGAMVSYAFLRMWTGRAGGYLVVGESVPGALTPGGAPPQAQTDRVEIDLRTGHTRAIVQAEQATLGFGDIAAELSGPIALEGARGALADDALPLVGGGLALGALVVLALLLYSRLLRARVLDAEARRAIHALVLTEPGLHGSEIRRRLGKAHGVGEYHLDVLVREGYLTSVATPGFRRYFVTGSMAPARMRATAALRDGSNEKLYRIIRENPGIQLTDLAARAGVTAGHASRRVERLREAGLVDKVQAGRAVALHAVEA